MIRMYQSQTSAQAKDYFRDALSKADYYLEDQELNGQFNGKIAKRLGIEKNLIDKETFEKLCDNINPKDGGSLTPRTVSDRRVGYDISFHCPKSVSILHALNDDKKVLQAFEESVHETMLDIEADTQTRVRTQGQYDDRHTGELIWTNFIHQTARAVADNPPDPHLHCHCFTFNATWDDTEGRFKAGQFHNIKKDMPYHQARFQKRLADKLSIMGHDIRKTKNGFELAVVPQRAIDHFSKRTNLIGQVATEKGITNPKELDQLGARTRAKKQKNLTMPQLQNMWREQLIDKGIDKDEKSEVKTTDISLDAKQSIDHAISHVFTRASVKRERQILTEGYKHAIDTTNVSLNDIDTAFLKNDTIFKVQVGSQKLCTTELVHAEERKMVNMARNGIGKLRPLKTDFKKSQFKNLNEEQINAISHVMTSQDRLTMIKGGAGTGKTTLLKAIVPEIENTGKEVFLFAPTAEASRDVLKKEGFEKADTVARFLLDKNLQEQIKGQVVWIDEAGMLGSQDMSKILAIVDKNQTRLILSGDPRQHNAVQRGDAMRILQTVAHIPHVSMETIYRQKQDGYKSAVKEISDGNIATGFDMLNTQGAIQEIASDKISQAVVDDYLKTRKDNKSALVISPTRAKAKEINQEIREGLKESKIIGKREKEFTVYENLYLTHAQKADSRSYRKGHIIQLHQNMPNLKKGAVLRVTNAESKNVRVEDKQGAQHILPLSRAKDFDVYNTHAVRISKGDEIKITKNGYDNAGKRLNNGSVLTVSKIKPNGQIEGVKKSNSKNSTFTLSPDHGNFDYAYASTSYSSQGKTVDNVIIAQPAVTFPASNQKQFYVSVSRGRESVTIYTDDREDLLSHIEKSGDRQGATELLTEKDFKTKTVDIDISRHKETTKDITPNKDYEPEL
ncbi:MobF family relaxase [Flavivirga sp. 57AJ16]|uniref:MobF family relaxase n=1 Tax=Flavivirga sp. 57AJ16 TaxID=3025307 RepID=UPI00236616B1|nr:MobF family relaxase [Flavivirga sp. 57AJ16]MDD7887870.1 MobF family relaxase [Flavivirga sp. 57AJ16]